MQKKALLPFGGDLASVVPYGMMWYGNTLAAPWPKGVDEKGRPLPAKEHNRQRMRAILKGLVYGGAGYMATRMAFPEDFGDKPTSSETISDKLLSAPGMLLRSQQVPEFLIPSAILPKAASLNEGESVQTANRYLIKQALGATLLNPGGHVLTRLLSDEGDPNAFETGNKGAWTSLGYGIGGGVLGGAAGGLAGILAGLMARKPELGAPALRRAVLAATGADLGSMGGALYGVYAGAKERAFKKKRGAGATNE